jgi:hypothetical protein
MCHDFHLCTKMFSFFYYFLGREFQKKNYYTKGYELFIDLRMYWQIAFQKGCTNLQSLSRVYRWAYSAYILSVTFKSFADLVVKDSSCWLLYSENFRLIMIEILFICWHVICIYFLNYINDIFMLLYWCLSSYAVQMYNYFFSYTSHYIH